MLRSDGTVDIYVPSYGEIAGVDASRLRPVNTPAKTTATPLLPTDTTVKHRLDGRGQPTRTTMWREGNMRVEQTDTLQPNGVVDRVTTYWDANAYLIHEGKASLPEAEARTLRQEWDSQGLTAEQEAVRQEVRALMEEHPGISDAEAMAEALYRRMLRRTATYAQPSAELRLAITEHGQFLRGLKYERLYVFGPDGRRRLTVEGDLDRVPVPANKIDELKNATVMHSHPTIYPVSEGDLITAMQHNVASVIATDGHYMYTVTRPADGWPPDGWNSFGSKVGNMRQEAKTVVANRIKTGIIDESNYKAEIWHEVLKRLSSQVGFHYVREVL